MALINLDCCLTDFLLKTETSFSKLSFENKKHVIRLGRALPGMTIDYKRRDGFFKHFHTSIYDKYTWLTGSCKLNKMFCFPCLLFSASSSVWSSTGFADINNLVNSAKKHVQTEKHIRSCVQLHDFGNTRIETLLPNSFESHNRKVDRNRDLMKRFIDTVILLGKQELPFRGHDESIESNNRGNYIETVLYLSKYDTVIDSHLEQCSTSPNPAFSGLSSDIQNDLIHCIASVIRDEIKSEIDKTHFVSVIIDETPDVSLREQLSIILRYLSNTGVEERFLGFIDISGSRNADALSSMLLNILKEYSCKDKLVSQSYNEAAVMSGERGCVQFKIRHECPKAIFIPCYAHSLNLVLSCSLEFVPELKVFFGHINSIVRFFNELSKRSNLLKEIADRRLPGVSETRWQYHSQIINVIFNCRAEIIETFNCIIDSPESWDRESLSMADCLVLKLQDMQFCFLLQVFSEIFEKTDDLFALLHSKQVDIEVAKREIETIGKWLSEQLKDKFDSIYDNVQQICEPPRIRRRLNSGIDLKTNYKRIFTEIIDNIKSQISHRYRSFAQLVFLDLINKLKYITYRQSFPDEKVSSLVGLYPDLFNFTALKNELKVLYTSASLNSLDVYELCLQLQNGALLEAFPQVLSLCSLFLTLPISVSSTECSFSALKRIHTFVRNTQNEGPLSDLAIISMEKRLLMKMKCETNFYTRVLAHFIKKNRQIALEYK